MSKNFFTLLLIPGKSTRVKRLVIHNRFIKWGILGGVVIAILLMALIVGFFHYRSSHHRDEATRLENRRYRSEIEQIRSKVASVETYLERVRRFDKKLRLITNLEDPERYVALGPLETGEFNLESNSEYTLAALPPNVVAPELGADGDHSSHLKKLDSLNQNLSGLETEAAKREGSLLDLETKLGDMRALLKATPGVWPARGWVTSNFGYRISPFSGERTIHNGLDIASRPGTSVMAPADGIVTFVGTLGGLGKTIVLNHGYGTITKYGHLSEIFVKLGDSIKRRDKLGTIGNTGRSTGPHLHYEVILNGIPRNPRKFILN